MASFEQIKKNPYSRRDLIIYLFGSQFKLSNINCTGLNQDRMITELRTETDNDTNLGFKLNSGTGKYPAFPFSIRSEPETKTFLIVFFF